MENILTSLLSIFCIDLSYTGLLSKRISPVCHILIMLNYAFWGLFFGNTLGQWATLPIVLFSCLIVYFGSKRNVLNATLAIVGYFVSTLTNHMISIPLSVAGISLEVISASYYPAFLTGWLLLTAIVLYLVRRFFILPRLDVFEHCSSTLLWILLTQLFFCVGIFMINFVYGSYINYPAEALSFNGILIVVFTLFTFVILYCIFNVFYKNQQLELHQQEQQHLLEYARQMESFYEEVRTFRHDYRNILLTMQYYIDNEEFAPLQEYFHTKILPSGDILSDFGFTIGKLHQIESSTLKSIFYTKLTNAKSRGITPILEITEPICNLQVDELVLCRILGILLDNCIEAAVESTEPLLKVAIVSMEGHVTFSLVNSTNTPARCLQDFFKSGWTTKKNHTGLGLASVQKMLENLDTVTYSMQYDTYVYQYLDVLKGAAPDTTPAE